MKFPEGTRPDSRNASHHWRRKGFRQKTRKPGCARFPPSVLSGPMDRRASIVVVLVGALLSLAPLAHASPPDATWIPGFYDDADYDDVVLAVTSAVTVFESAVEKPVGPVTLCLGLIRPSGPRTVSPHPLESASTRAPPPKLA